jgi:hypothetical protein
LQNFQYLIKVISRLVRTTELERIALDWLSSVNMFYCDNTKYKEEWLDKIESYCELLKWFILEQKYRISNGELERHFLILTELLSLIYE